jgi:hypothetical protein
MTLLLNLVGMSIGPSFAAIYQQMYQGSVEGVAGQFLTPAAYNLTFLTAALISGASVVLALSLSRRRKNIIHANISEGTFSKADVES